MLDEWYFPQGFDSQRQVETLTKSNNMGLNIVSFDKSAVAEKFKHIYHHGFLKIGYYARNLCHCSGFFHIICATSLTCVLISFMVSGRCSSVFSV